MNLIAEKLNILTNNPFRFERTPISSEHRNVFGRQVHSTPSPEETGNLVNLIE